MIPFVLVMRVGEEEERKSCVVEGYSDGRKVGWDKADPCSMLWLLYNIGMMLALSTLGEIKLLHTKRVTRGEGKHLQDADYYMEREGRERDWESTRNI